MGLSRYREKLEATIKEVSAVRSPELLYEPVCYGMAEGGKRLRPSLLLLAADACGGKADCAYRPAAGIEMYHNFTLLHDDVMDRSDTRRGRPTVYARWGTDAAILSGDTMLTLATQLISEVDDAVLRPVLDAFNSMAVEVYEGQSMDMEFEDRDDVAIDEYITMISKKTGALLGASAKIGSLIGGAGKETAEALYDFGMNLGIAFQIQDDWLDVYGDSATFGKPIGGDINNNKKTYLLIKAFEASGEKTEQLKHCLEMPEGAEKIAAVTALYTELGVSEECRRAIDRYTASALESLRRANLPEEYAAEFEALSKKLTGREK